MRQVRFSSALGAATLFLTCAGAQAGPIAAVQSVWSTLGGSFGNLTDQSGLSERYTAGVTDFDIYLASKPTHNSLDPDNDWLPIFTEGYTIFRFAVPTTIKSFALWNLAKPEDGAYTVRINVCADGASCDYLKSDHAQMVRGTEDAVEFQVFDFYAPDPVLAIRLDFVPSTFNRTVGLGEVIFETADVATRVPEPDALSLTFAAVGACLASRRRSRRPETAQSKR